MRQKPSKQKKGKTQNAMNTSVFRYIFCLLTFPLVNFLFIIIALFASFVHNSSFLVVDIAALILFNFFSAAYVLVPFSLFFRLEIERIRNSFPLNFFLFFSFDLFLGFSIVLRMKTNTESVYFRETQNIEELSGSGYSKDRKKTGVDLRQWSV